MKRLFLLGSLLASCWVLGVAQVAETNQVEGVVAKLDSVQVVVADSAALVVENVADSVAMADSVAVADSIAVADSSAVMSLVPDSLPIALRVLTDVDSTALIMEKVKAVTDMISAKSLLDAQLVKEVFSDTAIVNKYNRLLDKMVLDYEVAVKEIDGSDSTLFNPYFFRLFAPLTLYKTPVTNAMQAGAKPAIEAEDSVRLASMSSGRDLRLLNEMDRILMYAYLATPTRVQMTEDVLRASQSVSEEAMKSTANHVKLDVPTNLNIAQAAGEKASLTTDMVVQKPNFWKTKGTFSTQMTESFFSPNWYQGGINNINLLSTMTMEANYNNQKKTQWDNKLEARIGFYKNQGAAIQSNQDLLRLTSKLNLKAIRSWNYAIEAQGNTQMMNHFDGDKLKSRFLAPMDASLTVGMDYKKNFKNGSISIFPGPLSYKMSYVAVPELATRYGIQEGKQSRHDVGSKLEVNFSYKFAKNISYKTRFYYYTPYDYVQLDWENTFSFQVNKYISTTLFFHTRFDDHVARNDNWGFFQFKEYLTFGLNYSW
ncbi:MAG: DUF3078 domain-containing protein [Bacteroidaceae bacterium]|nr:DUF3078 domain-containing protein [Bacteroidaceae bacterium]